MRNEAETWPYNGIRVCTSHSQTTLLSLPHFHSAIALSSQSIILFLTVKKTLELEPCGSSLMTLLIRDGALAYVIIFGRFCSPLLMVISVNFRGIAALQIVTMVNLTTGNFWFEFME